MAKGFGVRVLFGVIGLGLLILQFDFSLANGEEFRYDSHGKKDPFVSPAQAVVTTTQMGSGELRLEGVIVDPQGSSYAIVNGQIVRQGEAFEGFLLKKVEPNQALFEKSGEHFAVVLRRDDELLKESMPIQENGQQPRESGAGSR